ncbi:MAG TPA: DUF222 domain-containing protein, partial [Propionibacteriaceae bacterium]|nr:DUF222 domain-containing protein [Propionibacteriaceae bacterium]
AHNLTPREAHRLIKTGQDLARFPMVGAAASSGAVLPVQADAITTVLRNLPPDFSTTVVADAQTMMVGFAATHTSGELRQLTGHLLEVLSPETADQLEAARLEREHATAMRNRHLEFTDDGHGSIIIRGSLPVTAAEPLIRIVTSYAAAKKRALDEADPHAEYVSSSMQLADGLLAMIDHHLQRALAPSNGGDRPRIVITLNYADLLAQATAAGIAGNGINGPHGCLVSTGEPIAPSEIRQLLCDADILPVVLGGRSEILDVGHTQRHAQGPIRYALEQRDRGCVFPGCDKPPTACHAHHITPWWAGGSTSLGNMALLCPHHHRIVEPTHNPDHDRWTIHINTDHLPEISPPKRVDTRQRPRLHARFRRHLLTGREVTGAAAAETRQGPNPYDELPRVVASPHWTT